MIVDLNTKVSGRFEVSVIDARTGATVRSFAPQKNLILDQGMDALATESWFNVFQWMAAGTGNTPTSEPVNGTASQSGTSVTLSGSSYAFTPADIGSWIKWTSGATAKITATGSSTVATVTPSQTVGSGSLTGIYRCGQTGLDTEVARVGGNTSDPNVFPEYTDVGGRWSQGFFPDDTTGVVDLHRTFDFPEPGSTTTYREIGGAYSATSPGNLFSRVVLSVPVVVTTGMRLRVRYILSVQLPHAVAASRPTSGTIAITGWPYAYSCSITSTSSDFTVTTGETHHFQAGGKIDILGATNAGYNGEWAIDSVGASTVTVLSTSNLGVATAIVQGNLKAKTYLQRWNLSADPAGGGNWNKDSTGAGWPATNGNPGTTTGSGAAVGALTASTSTGIGGLFDARLQGQSSPTSIRPVWFTTRVTPSTFDTIITGTGAVFPTSFSLQSYTAGNFYRDSVGVFSTGTLNSSSLRTLALGYMNSNLTSFNGLLIDFEEPQRKISTYTLTLTVRRSWTRQFS